MENFGDKDCCQEKEVVFVSTLTNVEHASMRKRRDWFATNNGRKLFSLFKWSDSVPVFEVANQGTIVTVLHLNG